jgi:hypothetical protein
MAYVAGRTDRVLSIDLDAFVSPTVYAKDSADHRRVASDAYRVLPAPRVLALTERLGFARGAEGACIEHHHQILDHLHRRIASGTLRIPFDLVHVDAHADLGWGEMVWRRLLGDIAGRPLAERQTFRSGITIGNWLSYAIVWGWVRSVLHVRPPADSKDRWVDVGRMFYRDGDTQRAELDFVFMPEVRHLTVGKEDPDPLAPGDLQRLQRGRPSVVRVPFLVRDFATAPVQRSADFVVLCRSPGFTPLSADRVYDLLRDRLGASP